MFLFRDLKTSFSVNGALLDFFTFPKGGAGPLGPPPESATGRSNRLSVTKVN